MSYAGQHKHQFSSQAEDRKSPRKRVLLRGTLITAEGPQSVTIRDLSNTGARLLAPTKLVQDSDALFRRGAIALASRVVWSAAGEVGIQFYRQPNEAELEQMRNGPAVVHRSSGALDGRRSNDLLALAPDPHGSMPRGGASAAALTGKGRHQARAK